jgi:hypothetical protein
MKYLKTSEGYKRNFKKYDSEFDKRKSEAETITININGKEIVYNPVDREILNDKNVGKYVVLKDYPFVVSASYLSNIIDELISYIKTNIGKIIISKLAGGATHYDIKYDNIPEHLKHAFTQRSYDLNLCYLICTFDNIDFISDNYDDCLTFITSKKYNL